MHDMTAELYAKCGENCSLQHSHFVMCSVSPPTLFSIFMLKKKILFCGLAVCVLVWCVCKKKFVVGLQNFRTDCKVLWESENLESSWWHSRITLSIGPLVRCGAGVQRVQALYCVCFYFDKYTHEYTQTIFLGIGE